MEKNEKTLVEMSDRLSKIYEYSLDLCNQIIVKRNLGIISLLSDYMLNLKDEKIKKEMENFFSKCETRKLLNKDKSEYTYELIMEVCFFARNVVKEEKKKKQITDICHVYQSLMPEDKRHSFKKYEVNENPFRINR